MKFLMIGLIAMVGYFVGVFGFAQIIGSLQHIRMRSISATIFTIGIWIIIFIGLIFLVHRFFYPYRIVYYVVSGIAFIQILAAGKIR